MSLTNQPLRSLREGRWFKLICGASYHHLPFIRNLALTFALAGADCIDVAADPAVISEVKAAFQALGRLREQPNLPPALAAQFPETLPWLMVSVSDGEDLHFRKATFDPALCPPDCDRPCERICPTNAITFDPTSPQLGVLEARCYGCGRCLPVCPLQHIEAVTQATPLTAIAPTVLAGVDAIEIHTQVGHLEAFQTLWQTLKPHLGSLKLISISCPDDATVIEYLWSLYDSLQPLSLPLIWQTDGRPMSGDLGRGTTHATLRYGQKVLQAGPPGFVQLAGGTNAHTVSKLAMLRAIAPAPSPLPTVPLGRSASFPTFGGIAYGSFARRLLSPLLEANPPDLLGDRAIPRAASTAQPMVVPYPCVPYALEASIHRLTEAVELAQTLVAPLKTAPPSALPLSTLGSGRQNSAPEVRVQTPGSLFFE